MHGALHAASAACKGPYLKGGPWYRYPMKMAAASAAPALASPCSRQQGHLGMHPQWLLVCAGVLSISGDRR
jgi:hypothetical protein